MQIAKKPQFNEDQRNQQHFGIATFISEANQIDPENIGCRMLKITLEKAKKSHICRMLKIT